MHASTTSAIPRSRRGLLLVAVLAATAAGALATVQAQESESAVGFWQAERARSAPVQVRAPVAQPLPAPVLQPMPDASRHLRSLDRSRQAAAPSRHLRSLNPDAALAVPPNAKLRYARLPKDEGREERADAKADPRKPPKRLAKGPMADILNDPTLRPGDVVMFPDGPRVFNGSGAAPHRMASFEEAGSSRLLGKGDRKLLASLSSQSGGAAKVAKLKVKGAAKTVAASEEPRSPGVRVVYQGYVAR